MEFSEINSFHFVSSEFDVIYVWDEVFGLGFRCVCFIFVSKAADGPCKQTRVDFHLAQVMCVGAKLL